MASSAGYAQALIGAADMMTGASAKAAYEAAYGKFYASYQGMHNAANQKVAAEANIAAVTQDRINTDRVIAMQQDRAEAQAKVAAAVTGTEGQSLDNSIYQTELNSSLAKQNNRQSAKQQIEQQLSSIYQSQSTMLAMDNVSVQGGSIASSIVNNLAPMIATQGDEFVEGFDNLFGSESSGDILLPE
jgi:hypothetical protein